MAPVTWCSRREPSTGSSSWMSRDRGAGFAPETAATAFERFTSGDSARTQASAGDGGRAGTGLGLAIVRAIAEAHGGSAEIVAATSGATVRITLPNGSQ